MINHHVALIYAMVLGAAADGALADSELEMIQGIVQHLPIFEDFEQGNLAQIASACTELLTVEDGIDAVISQIKENLPDRLRATAYALACDVVAADGEATQEELRYLEILRHDIGVDRLTAAAIERGAGARYARP